MTISARHRTGPRGATLVRVAVRAAATATAVGLLPAVCLVATGSYGPVAIVLVGVPALFVIGATACQVGWEWRRPTVATPRLASPGPGGVLSQAEAEGRLQDLITELWERDGCGS